jgi:plasmid stabilization system protein ParE
MPKRHGRPKFVPGSIALTPASPQPSRGLKLVVEYTQPLDVARAVEYLDEAIGEAEAAARWYAERSASAADGFADEIDAAMAAIEQNPNAWPVHDYGTRHYLLRRYPFRVVYRVEVSRILIVAVAHAHRRPAYWKSRVERRG